MALHEPALALLRRLLNGEQAWAIPWPCVHEFLSTVTRLRYFHEPSTVEFAVATVERWRECPVLHFISEGNRYWQHLTQCVAQPGVHGPKVHDARIAAICLSHGVSELLTADRDFSYFPQLKTRNPLVQA